MGSSINKTILIVLSFFILYFISGCNNSLDVNDNGGSNNHNNDTVYFKIDGVIRDSITNSQLDSVFISIPGDTTFLSYIGLFELKNRMAGTYNIYFTKKNYTTKLYEVRLTSDTTINVYIVKVKVPIPNVDYFPLSIGNSWTYYRQTGRLEYDDFGTETWTVQDSTKLLDGSTEYSIHTVFNGKNYSHITHDTTDVIDEVEDFIISQSSDSLLLIPVRVTNSYFDQFSRFYPPSSPDTIKMEYGSIYYDDYKLYITKNTGIVYSYFRYFGGNTHPYAIYTLIQKKSCSVP